MTQKSRSTNQTPPEIPMHQSPIVFNYPENLPAYYSRIFSAQIDEHEIILSFFDARIPILTGSPEQMQEQAAQLQAIRADCLFKVIIAPERLPEYMNVLRTAAQAYQSTYGKNLLGDA